MLAPSNVRVVLESAPHRPEVSSERLAGSPPLPVGGQLLGAAVLRAIHGRPRCRAAAKQGEARPQARLVLALPSDAFALPLASHRRRRR